MITLTKIKKIDLQEIKILAARMNLKMPDCISLLLESFKKTNSIKNNKPIELDCTKTGIKIKS